MHVRYTGFNNLDHDRLLEMLKERIDDRTFLGLIRRWLKTGPTAEVFR